MGEARDFISKKGLVCVLVGLQLLTLLLLNTRSLPFLSTARSAIRLRKLSNTSAGIDAVDAAISGVTGQVFKGRQVRTYDGPLLLSGSGGASMQGFSSSLSTGEDTVYSSKWAVVTTIHSLSPAVLSAVALQGWAVVIVGDQGGVPINTSAPNVVYLDAAAQQCLGRLYALVSTLLPWRHFGRKNIGYLYAVAHGAKQVWDFDDDNALQDNAEPRLPSSHVHSIQTNSCLAFNPYPLMGAPVQHPSAWPRGLPLHLIKRPCKHVLVPASPATIASVAVVQSLANHEPDVDGIFRLTRAIPFDFDSKAARTLVMPHGTLAPYNAQATLVLQPALWSLLLPVTVHGRVSDIWRGYIAQRLLWDLGLHIAFAPPMVRQARNPHDALADMDAEQDLYQKSLALVTFLQDWQGTASSLPGRFEQLVVDLYERQYIELADVQLTQQWLLALSAAGYAFPALTLQASSSTTRCPTSNIDLFMVSSKKEFPLLHLVLRSIDAFMPCRGHIHIVIDAPDRPALRTWVNLEDVRVHVHDLTLPQHIQGLRDLPGYLAQQWVMLWADKLVASVGSQPEYIMYLDTDSVLALPVTCASLFDKQGRVYIGSWSMARQPQFAAGPEELLGIHYTSSYMSFFPFTYPVSALPRLRQHIVKTIRLGRDFDRAFGAMMERTKFNDTWQFSQFVVMGAYAAEYERDSVHVIHCPAYNANDSSHADSECASWLPVGVHYGWRYCWYLYSCLPDRWDPTEYHTANPGDLGFSRKFSEKGVKLVEELIAAGTCYKHALGMLNGKQFKHDVQLPLPPGCNEQQLHIHSELRPYPQDNVTVALQQKWADVFSPDSGKLLCNDPVRYVGR